MDVPAHRRIPTAGYPTGLAAACAYRDGEQSHSELVPLPAFADPG